MRIKLTRISGASICIPVGSSELAEIYDGGTEVFIGSRSWIVRETIDEIHALEATAKAPPAEEPEWRKRYSLPLKLLDHNGNVSIAFSGGAPLTGCVVRRDSDRGQAYAHIVKCVNEREREKG